MAVPYAAVPASAVGTAILSGQTGFTVGHGPLTQAGLSGQDVVSYQLGPVSAGIGSPLGALFGFLNDVGGSLGSAYNAGLHLVINDPQDAGRVLTSDQYSSFSAAEAARIAKSQERDLSSNPFRAAGNVVGAIIGTGTAATGLAVGSAGATAAPGVSQGAQSGAQGVSNVAAAGASGGFLGTVQGLGAGLATTLGANAGDPTLLYIGALLVIAIILLK